MLSVRWTIPLYLAAATAQPALAQAGTIEEIIVTADYREAALDTIPASVTVIGDEVMRRKNAQHLEDILLNAPNVNFASGASRARFIQIRGIGERGQFVEPLNASVGLIIDGVDFSGIGNAALLYDMEQVEILMGPQGTRYGSNALAGLVNLQSKAPTPTPTYGLQLQSGNLDERGIAGYVSGPATDDLFYRLAVQVRESDGFGHNAYLDRPTNTRDEVSLRGKFRWLLNATDQLDVTAALVDLDNGYDAFSLDNTRETLSDEPGFDRQDSKLGSLKYTTSRFEKFTLEAMAGHAQSGIDYGYDEDWAYAGIHPYGYSSTDHYFRDRETNSGEIRLLSSDTGRLFNDSTDWVFGIYALHQQVDLLRDYTFAAGLFSSDFSIDRLAVYGDTRTQLGGGWRLDFGLRLERFSADYDDSSGVNFSPDDDLVGGKIALNYMLGDNALLYVSASRGYKSGGFNTDGSLDADLREFAAETLWNLEAGYKAALLDGRLDTRLALFYMDRNDVQVSSSTVRQRADGSSEFIDFTGNAATGRNLGLELSANALVNDRLVIYGSLGLLDTEYRNFINSAGDNLDGREQAHAPPWQFTLGGSLALGANLNLDVNVQGRDGFYFSDSHGERSSRYTLLNASLVYQQENWRLTLWGRNLTDKDYHVRGYYFGNDPRDDYAAKGYRQFGEPRRYGLTMNLDFQ